MAAGKIRLFRPEVGLDGCDTEALVLASERFAELELEMVRRSEVTAAQLAAEKVDWGKVGSALGRVYQMLGDRDDTGTMAALHEIEVLLSKRGILVQQPLFTQRMPQLTTTSPAEARPENQPEEARQEGVHDGE